MKTILLTGPIGSGKSTVAAILRERGVPVYDSDSAAKSLYTPEVVKSLEALTGQRLSMPDGHLDKKALAGHLFSSGEFRLSVEKFIYPLLTKDFESWREARGDSPFVVFESAIALSKPQFRGLWDGVVVLSAPLPVRISRVMLRDGMSEEEALRREASQQIPSGDGFAIIVNNGSPEVLASAVESVFFSNNSYICKLLNKV